MFRTREMRLGKGVLYTPGTAVPTRPRMLHDRRLPHHSGASLISPVLHPAREVMLTRHHQGFPVSRPGPSLPLACGPRPERGPSGFPASFTPGRYRPRMSRWGQVTDTNPESRHRHQPASTSTDSLLTCDLTSQALRIPPGHGHPIACAPSPCGPAFPGLPGRPSPLATTTGTPSP
jgi:hypothetical protein